MYTLERFGETEYLNTAHCAAEKAAEVSSVTCDKHISMRRQGRTKNRRILIGQALIARPCHC